MKVKNVMTVDVTSVSPKTSLKRAHLAMIEHGVRHLPVVERGKLTGIVSDRDLLGHARRGPPGRVTFARKTVAQVMARSPFTSGPRDTVSQLARLMIDEKVDAVPITSKRHALLGLVTSSDLLLLLTELPAPCEPLPFAFNLRRAKE